MSADAVSSWLEQHGGPRRFSTGDSGDRFALKQYLASKGYDLSLSGGVYTSYRVRALQSKGRGRSLKRGELFAMIDAMRKKDGLPSLLPVGGR